MDGGDHRDRQLLDAVEEAKRLLHHLLDLSLGDEAGEFADVGADQETSRLGAHQHEALDLAVDGGGFGPFDDFAEFLGEPAPHRVHALAFAVHERPGDALVIDGEAPVVKCGDQRRHDRPYSAAIESFGGVKVWEPAFRAGCWRETSAASK
jgi:hypothetical protein